PRPIADLESIRSKFKDTKSKNWLVIIPLFILVFLVILEKRFGLHKKVLEKLRALKPQIKQIDTNDKPVEGTNITNDDKDKPLQ
ncbi:MAG: hypothetical protein UT10_C0013G0001, partial [Candidatus Woesebacteria bacterium GW2011_GWB1_38_8b]